MAKTMYEKAFRYSVVVHVQCPEPFIQGEGEDDPKFMTAEAIKKVEGLVLDSKAMKDSSHVIHKVHVIPEGQGQEVKTPLEGAAEQEEFAKGTVRLEIVRSYPTEPLVICFGKVLSFRDEVIEVMTNSGRMWVPRLSGLRLVEVGGADADGNRDQKDSS